MHNLSTTFVVVLLLLVVFVLVFFALIICLLASRVWQEVVLALVRAVQNLPALPRAHVNGAHFARH